jgi:glycosyltransferase involved in cell wall biosynthesis
MNILFIHQNFPGQFPHLAAHLAADPRNKVAAICQAQAPRLPQVPNTFVYEPARRPGNTTHHYLRSMEDGVLNGQAVAKVLLKLKKGGFVPDVVIAHPGWGEALYVKDIFPQTKLVSLFEFYYHAEGADVNFDPEFPLDLDGRARIRTRNGLHLLNLTACDAGVSPTHWQKSLHPREFHSKISVIHEGINTGLVVPNPAQTFQLPNGKVLTRRDEVITYVARNLEPYRGFHQFMRAAQEICQRRPNAEIVIVGGDEVSYGQSLPNGQTYRQKLLQDVRVDVNRVHFLGKIPYPQYLALLQVSSAHVYLTVPFVLSWSMLEAMSAGCLVIGSDTAPVREALVHGKNGLLVDFFSPAKIAERVDEVFAHPDRMQAIRQAARQSITERYEVGQSIKRYGEVISSVLSASDSKPRNSLDASSHRRAAMSSEIHVNNPELAIPPATRVLN